MTVRVDHEMEALEGAANAQDEGGFVRAAKTIDWQNRSSADVVRAIRLALEAGAYMTARELSDKGLRLFPEDDELRQLTVLLAPPRVIGRSQARDSGIRANCDWLRAHSDEYRGKWIGLHKGKLVAVAESLDELTRNGVPAKDILITRVY